MQICPVGYLTAMISRTHRQRLRARPRPCGRQGPGSRKQPSDLTMLRDCLSVSRLEQGVCHKYPDAFSLKRIASGFGKTNITHPGGSKAGFTCLQALPRRLRSSAFSARSLFASSLRSARFSASRLIRACKSLTGEPFAAAGFAFPVAFFQL